MMGRTRVLCRRRPCHHPQQLQQLEEDVITGRWLRLPSLAAMLHQRHHQP